MLGLGPKVQMEQGGDGDGDETALDPVVIERGVVEMLQVLREEVEVERAAREAGAREAAKEREKEMEGERRVRRGCVRGGGGDVGMWGLRGSKHKHKVHKVPVGSTESRSHPRSKMCQYLVLVAAQPITISTCLIPTGLEIHTNIVSKLDSIDTSSNPSIIIDGKYVWKLVFDYDNSRNASSIVHSFELTTSGSYTSHAFNEVVSPEGKKLSETCSIQLEFGASYGPVSTNVKNAFHTSKEVISILEKTTREQTEGTESYVSREIRNYIVGAHSRLVLYQRVFQGPGITVEMETLKTTSTPLPNDQLIEIVPIELVLVPKKFV
ncbi:hypothetical protein E4T56_gene18759 [Termitomyces sp. T112]|nr:hypothetical protein E4T56_gene18759 [Termitomyces sp. T112]